MSFGKSVADIAMKGTVASLVGLTAYYTLFIVDRGMAISQGRTSRQQLRILAKDEDAVATAAVPAASK